MGSNPATPTTVIRGVAQPGSAFVWGAKGRGFEPRHSDHPSLKLRVAGRLSGTLMQSIKNYAKDCVLKLKKENIIKIGIGVWVFNPSGQVLLGQRLSSHGFNTWAAPGGKPEIGESIRSAAVREVFEETGLTISSQDLNFLSITHDVFPDSFYRTIHFRIDNVDKNPVVREKDKCAKWQWFDLNKLPSNLFLSAQNLLKQNVFGV